MNAIPILPPHPIPEKLARADAFEPPPYWPTDLEASRALVVRYGERLAVQVGRGELTVDDAYHYARAIAERAQVSTQGRHRWRDAFPYLTWTIDEQAPRIAEWLAVQAHRAELDLRRIAGAAIAAGQREQAVRRAIVEAAQQMEWPPPASVLHAAYMAAVSEARRNAQWMSRRETA